MQVNAASMNAISQWMGNSAHNVANVNTDGFNANRTTMNNENGSVVAQSSPVEKRTELSKELSDQMVIDKSFEANAQAIKTKDSMIGSLLDLSV